MDKPTRPRLFDELVEAFDDLKEWKEGKITLKTYPLGHPELALLHRSTYPATT